MTAVYLRLEILRVLRVPQLLAVTVGLPVVLFLVFAGLYEGDPGGMAATAYSMQGMAAYGSLGAAMYSATGVAMPVWQWAALAAATWAALPPFVLLGIALGFLGTSESIQAVTTFLVLALALFGGMWFPVEIMPGAVQAVAHALPSYWLNAVGRAVMGAPGFGWTGLAVLVEWTVAIAVFAATRYRADAKRA